MSGDREALAEWLRDERMMICDHFTGMGPSCCSPCLRDAILTSPWLAAVRRDAAAEGAEKALREVEARIREQAGPTDPMSMVWRAHIADLMHIEAVRLDRAEAAARGHDTAEGDV